MVREPLFADTDEETERRLLKLARAMPAWKKLEEVEDISNTCQQLALIGLQNRYPEASERELRLRLAARIFGRELIAKAYGWDADAEVANGDNTN